MENTNKVLKNQPFSREAEYAVIRKDLIKVVLLNLVYLIAVLALWYTNKQSHYLNNWFNNIFHF